MKVIGHDHKLMKLVFALNPIVKQSLNEEPCGSLRLKKSFLLGCGRCHKVRAVSGCPAVWNCHKTFRAKARFGKPDINAALKRCSAHEKSHQARTNCRADKRIGERTSEKNFRASSKM